MYTHAHATTWKATRQQLLANIPPELRTGQGALRLQLFNTSLDCQRRSFCLAISFPTLHHRSLLLPDCSTFICTRVKQLFSNFIHLGLIFFFIVQWPGKADTMTVLGLAITIRREERVKFLCDRTGLERGRRGETEIILVGPLEVFP